MTQPTTHQPTHPFYFFRSFSSSFPSLVSREGIISDLSRSQSLGTSLCLLSLDARGVGGGGGVISDLCRSESLGTSLCLWGYSPHPPAINLVSTALHCTALHYTILYYTVMCYTVLLFLCTLLYHTILYKTFRMITAIPS